MQLQAHREGWACRSRSMVVHGGSRIIGCSYGTTRGPSWSGAPLLGLDVTWDVLTFSLAMLTRQSSAEHVVSLHHVWFCYRVGMRVAACDERDGSACPVDEWQHHGFSDRRRDRSRVRVHRSTKRGGRRFQCMECRRTFSLDRVRAAESRDAHGFGTYREQLMFEVLWSVRCEGVPLNLASRRVGVDWATGRRWRDQVSARYARSGRLKVLCHPHNTSMVGRFRMGRSGRFLPPWMESMTPADEPWFFAAHAAEVLFQARDAEVIDRQTYQDALRELTDRRIAGTDAWEARLKAVAG